MKAPKAARLAVKKGYKNVYLYQEGIKGWKKKGNKLVRQEPIPTLPVAVLPAEKVMALIKKNPGTVLLDIRDFDLFNKMRIKVPHLLHIRAIDVLDQMDKLPRDQPIVLIDHVANQVRIVSPYLKAKGFQVRGYVEGGATGWAKSGQPFEILNK